MAATPLAHPHISEEAMQELGRIISYGDPDQGTMVEELEREFARHTSARHAVAVSSGTAALHLALLAHGIGPGHEVITSPLCLPDVGTAIVATGARPVYADVNAYTYTISPLAAEHTAEAVKHHVRDCGSRRAGALLAVHLFGQPCDMAALSEIAERHELVLIEVAWDALGARYDHASVGSFGTACYSFLPGMAIVTGQGGMLTTDDEVVAATVRRLANHGCDCHGRVREPGFNYRTSEVIAAMALQQLPHVAQHIELQRHWAGELTHGLCALPGIIPPAETPGGMHSFQRYAIRIAPEFPLSRERVQEELQAWSVATPSEDYLPLHQHPFHSTRRDKARALSNAERVAQELLFLPMHPNLNALTVNRIVRALHLMASCVTERECPPKPDV
jgi:dTDP-4-amino-4,6-dideoxygalactose transaminase